MTYDQAKKELLQFTGIGPKVVREFVIMGHVFYHLEYFQVADCILLMSLDKPSAIPVDTHMFQIAANKYLPHLKGYKSVTDKVCTSSQGRLKEKYPSTFYYFRFMVRSANTSKSFTEIMRVGLTR